MDFIEFLANNGKLNSDQKTELYSILKNQKEKPGKILLKKKFLSKQELLSQLQIFAKQ